MGGDLGRSKVAIVTCYVVSFFVEFAFVGSLDAAYDAMIAVSDIARGDAEGVLSLTFEVAVVLGLVSLWVYEVRMWLGGIATGLSTALAAGGLHVMGHVGMWLLPAFLFGAVTALVLPVFTQDKPLVCTLLGVEVSLAAVQVLFVVIRAVGA